MGKHKRSHKGGAQLPIQWFNPKSTMTNYYPTGSPHLRPGASAYGPTVAVDLGNRTGNNHPGMVGPNYGPMSPKSPTSGLMTGGSDNPYNTIVNPFTGRKCSIFSKTGRNVLSYYVDQLDQ